MEIFHRVGTIIRGKRHVLPFNFHSNSIAANVSGALKHLGIDAWVMMENIYTQSEIDRIREKAQ